MAKYKFPGVYLEEKMWSPSVEPLDNIAVFIGYTEKNILDNGEDLLFTPITINSILEFENTFGFGQPEKNLIIKDNSSSTEERITVEFSGEKSKHILYYSIKLFFESGGNKCKIVSVGTFKEIGEILSAEELIQGIDSLKNEKINLLIGIPESQNLPENDFYLVQQKILEFCDKNRYFGILDPPRTNTENFLNKISIYREKLHSDSLKFGAAFFPSLQTTTAYLYDESCINVEKNGLGFSLNSFDETKKLKYVSAIGKFSVILPASPSVMGLILKNDMERGIWKAPSTIPLKQIIAPEFLITDSAQQLLNVDILGKSINCIRNFQGVGNRVWGTRTLAGNDAEWKYFPIRRLANKIEKEIQNALDQFVYEKNNSSTWAKIKSITENYLYNLWRSGALMGSKPEHAYFVKCGLNETMTNKDISDGKLLLQIGFSPLRPAEFIFFNFSILAIEP